MKWNCMLVFVWVWLLGANCYGQVAVRNEVLINEIMMDPDPAVQLPNVEYIELINTSKRTINLSGWKLVTAASASSAMPAYQLPPDSMVVICKKGDSLPVRNQLQLGSFPSLPNESGSIAVQSNNGALIDAVAYDRSAFKDETKAAGGWSLERIDAQHPCLREKNWVYCKDLKGGTPARSNSVKALLEPPLLELRKWWMIGADEIHLRWNLAITVRDKRQWSVKDGPEVFSVSIPDPLQNEVIIKLAAPLSEGLYVVKQDALTDQCGIVQPAQEIRIGPAVAAKPGDLRFNELLFNPVPGGSDYFELYHAGKQVIDLSQLQVLGLKSNGMLSEGALLSEEPLPLLPGSYSVFTADPDDVIRRFKVPHPNLLTQLSAMPSMPDDGSTLVLRDRSQQTIDSVVFRESMHFPLLPQFEGVALEKRSPVDNSRDVTAWTSAAASAGFGTPTAVNSQYTPGFESGDALSVEPVDISPNLDGHADFAQVQCRSGEPGRVANLVVFNLQGEMVRHLARNQTLAAEARWIWDGLGDEGKVCPAGPYVLWLELFDLQGHVRHYKKAVRLW